MSRVYKLLPCPFCGGETTVLYARGQKAGTFRRRECADCFRSFSTEERIVGLDERSGNGIHEQTLVELVESLGIPVIRDAA